MGTIRITGPDGRVARITPPEGATDEQIQAKIAEVKRNWPGRAPQAQPQQRSWADVPMEALGNAPRSALEFGKAVAQPVMAPIETAKGLGHLAAGIGSKMVSGLDAASEFLGGPDLQTPEQKAYAEAPLNALGGFYADRYGSLEGLKNTLATDPVGFAADITLPLYGAGALVPGRAGRVLSKVGSAVDPVKNVGRAAKVATKGAGQLLPGILGLTTGAGATPVRTAYKAGRRNNAAFADQMRGTGNMEDVVGMAERGVGELSRQRNAHYAAWMPGVKADKTALDFTPVRAKLQAAEGMAAYHGVVKNPEAATVLQEITSLVDQFDAIPNGAGRTIDGMDALKQAVGDVWRGTKQGTTAHKIAGDVYREIGDQIKKQAPQYAEIMKSYSQASDTIGDMRRSLSINDRASTDTTMRKLQSVMRNNVNTNYGARQKLVDELARIEPDLPYALAGQALNSPTPRGLQTLGAGGAGIMAWSNPSALAMMPAFSPRLVGEAAYAAGRSAKAIESVASASGIAPDALARALLMLYATGTASEATEE